MEHLFKKHKKVTVAAGLRKRGRRYHLSLKRQREQSHVVGFINNF
jgi:hypothetical protein